MADTSIKLSGTYDSIEAYNIMVEMQNMSADYEEIRTEAAAAASAATAAVTTAQTAANSASTYAGNAQTYAGNANTSAGEAAGYASDASTAATNAASSETNASNSASAAATSAANAAASEAVVNGALPLSGGTMTGAIQTDGVFAKNTVDTSLIRVYGGTTVDNGAVLNLYGKSHPSSAGYFSLKADNGSNESFLTGTPSGSLSWGGVSITDGTFLTTRNVTVNVTTTGTGVKVGTATAPAVSKYQFVCWTYCVSSGGVFPAYPSSPQNSTSEIWACNPISNSKVICHALYVRKW